MVARSDLWQQTMTKIAVNTVVALIVYSTSHFLDVRDANQVEQAMQFVVQQVVAEGDCNR